jgi:hypothetical protein
MQNWHGHGAILNIDEIQLLKLYSSLFLQHVEAPKWVKIWFDCIYKDSHTFILFDLSSFNFFLKTWILVFLIISYTKNVKKIMVVMFLDFFG